MSISTLKWRQQKTLKDCEHRCTHWKIAEDKPQYKVNWRYRHQRRQKNLKDCEHHCTLRQMTDDKSQWDKFNWRYKPPYMKDHSLLFLFILQVITSYLELTRKAMLWPGPLMKTTHTQQQQLLTHSWWQGTLKIWRANKTTHFIKYKWKQDVSN